MLPIWKHYYRGSGAKQLKLTMQDFLLQAVTVGLALKLMPSNYPRWLQG